MTESSRITQARYDELLRLAERKGKSLRREAAARGWNMHWPMDQMRPAFADGLEAWLNTFDDKVEGKR